MTRKEIRESSGIWEKVYSGNKPRLRGHVAIGRE